MFFGRMNNMTDEMAGTVLASRSNRARVVNPSTADGTGGKANEAARKNDRLR